MHTTISPSQLAAMDSCFGPAGPHQHGIANVLGGCLKHLFKWQLCTTDVLSWVGNSTAVLPLQACGKVDQQKRPVCHIIFKYTCTKSKVTQAPTQLVFVSPCLFFVVLKIKGMHAHENKHGDTIFLLPFLVSVYEYQLC